MDTKELNLDTFGEMMDDIITKTDVRMLIELPEGTQEAQVIGTGIATVEFFVLNAAIVPTLAQIIRDLGGRDKLDVPGVLDGLWEYMKHDILEKLDGEAG